MRLRAGAHLLDLPPQRPAVMGIVNIGDDSVADTLRLRTLDQQLARARRLLADGARIIDVGVQSGRTDTDEIPVHEEVDRLLPLVSQLSAEGVIVSVDTWRAQVADAAVKAGASIVNDVGGLAEPEIAQVAARSGAGLVLMHTRAAPKVASFPGYEDPLADVMSMLSQLTDAATQAGVEPEQLLLDPGLDYAKTPQESVEVLRRLPELHALQRPLLLAVSRKYFVGMLTGRSPVDRLPGTLAALSYGLDAGAQVLRVHDVVEVCDFLAVRAALRGEGAAQMRGDPQQESLKWLPPKGAAGAAMRQAAAEPATASTNVEEAPA